MENIATYVNAVPNVGYLLDGRVNGRVSAFSIGTDYKEKLEFTDNLSFGNINGNRSQPDRVWIKLCRGDKF